MLNFILGKNLAFYVRRHRKLLIASIFLTILATLFAVIPAYLIQPFLDQGMKTGSQLVTWKVPWIELEPGSWTSWHRTERVVVEGIPVNTLIMLLAGIAFLSILAKSLSTYIGELCAAAFSNRAVRSLRADIFAKFVSLPLEFHYSKRSGELIARATADVGRLQAAIVQILIGLIQHPLTALVFLIYLLILNFKLTLFVICMTPLIVGIVRLFNRKVKKHAFRVQDATADVTSAYQETLLCIKIVLGFFKGKEEGRRFQDLVDILYKRTMRLCRWNLGMKPILDATGFLVLPAILFAGKTMFDHSLGELVAMLYAFHKVYDPVKKLAKVQNNLKGLQGATQRVFAIMAITPKIRDPQTPQTLSRHHQSVEFANVSFSYPLSKPVLKNISFNVKAGEMAAFVGSTGAGKSTLVDLIPRFYDVTEGNILIDGIDTRDMNVDSLRKQIGIVSQKTLLFNRTIKENICYGLDEADMNKCMQAAITANAHDFIMAQPNGYDTIIGDQGILLSGGQRQRIAIARAILIEPAILILDEAASALDAQSESLVQKAIEDLQGSRTIIAVAHRLSTIIKANRIYVLEEGRIVESGTLQELLARNGRFKQLYDLQFAGGSEESSAIIRI